MADWPRGKRCRMCRHWDDNAVYDMPHWGCCNLAESNWGEPEHKPTLAVAIDYDAHVAYLHTHEKFGCIQWEVKDNV